MSGEWLDSKTYVRDEQDMTTTPNLKADTRDRHGVRAVERAFDILTAFSDAHPRLALHELAEATCLPKASVHRIAATMIDYGFLRQAEDGSYLLGMRIMEVARHASSSSLLLKIAKPIAQEMSELTGETVLCAEVDWKDRTVLIVDRIDAAHTLTVLSPVGRQSHLSCGCIAKAALSGWPAETASRIIGQLNLASRTPRSITDPLKLAAEVRASRLRGYATEQHEFCVGIVGVGVPVMVTERPIGVVAVVAPSVRCNAKKLNEIGIQLRDAMAHQQQLADESPQRGTSVASSG
jgi:DNA-binding IclR family transcriptional regulator